MAGNNENRERRNGTLKTGRDEHDRSSAVSQCDEVCGEMRNAAMAARLAFRTGARRGITQPCFDADVMLQRACECSTEAAPSEQDGRGHQNCEEFAETRAHGRQYTLSPANA